MRRADFFQTIFKPVPVQNELVLSGGLEPYTGSWNFKLAKHLLRRASFGPSYTQVKLAQTMGLEATIDMLFDESPLPDLPLNYDNNNDPNVPVGESWVFAPLTQGVNYSTRSMRAWQMGNYFTEATKIREKMVLFWHNHFVTANPPHGKYTYQYIDLIRSHALGNFKTLTTEMTVNPLMLRYLNGNENNKKAPNENYARELLELFTLGKGLVTQPGDYTNYTEEDIKQIAKCLTGWINQNALYNEAGPHPPALFRPQRHETSDKTLSYRLGNEVIPNLNEEEYKKVVDILFGQPETSRFIAREIYKWFVYYDITSEVELNVIEPMAQLLRDQNYEIAPVIRALLSSQHFYDENAIGCQIKSPIDFVMSIFKTFEVELPDTVRQKYLLWQGMHTMTSVLQQEMFNPPDVAGWKAYYQEPGYYRSWINSVTLPFRRQVTDKAVQGEAVYVSRAIDLRFLSFIAQIPNAEYPDQLITGICDFLLPNGISDNQLLYLKDTLIPGLPDFEWTVEYGQYLNDPDDEAIRMGVEARLKSLFTAILGMPEFQLQ